MSLRTSPRLPRIATAATWTPGKARRTASRWSSSFSHFAPRVARNARATGPRSNSWQTLRIAGPRTWQAGRFAGPARLGPVATVGAPVTPPSAGGAAHGGPRTPTLGPVQPLCLGGAVVGVEETLPRD